MKLKILMIKSGMLNFLDKIPYSILIVFTIMMLAAPLKPMPHVVEKILMLKNGSLHRPIDIFDLFFHLLPLILLTLKLVKDNR
ncbi:MAG: RND transporter [Desulfobacula sp.]|nr:RND transporter [Desulfobacula sp.]